MDLIVCINCKSEFIKSENTFYCPKCLAQNICKFCGNQLVKGSIGCVNCGSPINSNFNNDAINKIEYEQKGETKKFTATFTNTIGENLVLSLGSLFGNSVLKPTNSINPFSHKTITTQNIKDNNLQSKTSTFDEALIVDETDGNELNNVIEKIFRVEDDKLILVNQRVKQTGKLDHAIRLSLLTLYGYSCLGKKQVPRSILNEILNHAKVYDSNYRKWMSKCDEISKLENGDILELSLPGITSTKNILKEFVDSNIESGSIKFSGLNRSKRKKKKNEAILEGKNIEPSKKTVTSKKTPLQNIEELIQENYFSDKHRIKDIISFMKDKKATTITNSTLSTVLGRLVKNSKLKREKNSSDGQYEYFK